MERRDVLKAGGTALAALAASTARAAKKSVIVMGAGIAGLSCAYELKRLGHDVTVLEASGRAGGHVRTFHDQFADGLYADIGAEHFYYPGYTEYWRYLKEFSLTAIPYPRRDNMVRFLNGERYSEQDLQSRPTLGKLGFNQREMDFLSRRPWADLPLLFLERYVDRVRDEANPFERGLSELDSLSVTALLNREGASAAAVQYAGGSGNALQSVWAAAIKKLRGTDLESKKLFRLKGGNQLMTDAFAARLGNRVRLGCPVTRIEHGPSGVTVSFREFGKDRKLAADYLVCCVSAVVLRQIPVSPAWPESKNFVLREMPYYTRTRVVFQSRTKFWETDKVSPNWLPPDPRLNELWSMAEDVNTPARNSSWRRAGRSRRSWSARSLRQAVSRQIGRHRAGARARLVQGPLGRHVRAHRLQARRTQPFLARSRASLRSHPFRRSVCRADVLGSGGGIGIRQSSRARDRSGVKR